MDLFPILNGVDQDEEDRQFTSIYPISSALLEMNYSENTIDNIDDDAFIEVFDGFSPLLLELASFCCIILMLIGIPGNLITIIALARCRKIRNATTFFIMNLSFSDLLFCCFNLPLAASMYYNKGWKHGRFMCRLFPLFRYGLLAVSLVTILTITINRYVMISHPKVYPKVFKNRNLIIIIAITWLFGFGSLIQTWNGNWGEFGLDETISSCSIKSINGKSPKQFLFLMAFVLPCLVIVLSYARIFYIVRKAEIKAKQSQIKSSTSMETEQVKILIDEGSSMNEASSRISHPKIRLSELKFIDTSVESEFPPTLSVLQERETTDTRESDLNVEFEDQSISKADQEPEPSSSSSGVDVSFDKNSEQISSSRYDQPQSEDGGENRQKSKKYRKSKSKYRLNKARSSDKMSRRDKKLLMMILVIFVSYLICYLPITLSKLFPTIAGVKFVFIMGYLLIYCTTCINPIIYVFMSSEYRKAYKNLLTCSTHYFHSEEIKRQS